MARRRATGRRARARRALRGLAERLCDRSYPTAKLFYLFALRFLFPRGGPPILVYQMAKVGSSTVARSLAARRLPNPIFHVHWLTGPELARAEARARERWARGLATSQSCRFIWEGQYLRRRLAGRRPGERWYVVSLVRDPVARNISDFFRVGPDGLGLDFRAEAIDVLGAAFLERYTGHDEPLVWFDEQLKTTFGLDVYERPFPQETGYAIYENELVRALVIRLEDLRSCAAPAFQEWVGLDGFELVEANVTEPKATGALYRTFVESVELPPEYLSRMYGSRYARHFYSAQELARFRDQWEHRPAEALV
jgi:Putative capsular polysaccharide synthesis protein